MQEQFISEAITPVPGTTDTRGMSRGEPGLPERFTWRDQEYEVAEVTSQWKDTGGCHHGSAERYVRKHWFEIRTTDGTEMRIYFERQPRRGQTKQRWWLQAVTTPGRQGQA